MTMEKKKFSRKEMKKPDEFLQKSWELGEWISANGRQILIVTGVVVVSVLAGASLWSYMDGRKIASSRSLDGVLEVSARSVAPTKYAPGKEGAGDEDTYGSQFHKDEALLKAYRAARDGAKSEGLRKTATLGIASTLLGLERWAEAKKEYETLRGDPSGMESMVHALHEGLGFAAEGMGKPDEAMKHYKALEGCEGGKYAPLALYHEARVREKKGDAAEAKKTYERLSKKINEAKEFTPLLSYVQERIAGKEGVAVSPPSYFPPPGGGPGGQTQITPEMLEELKKRLADMKGKEGAPAPLAVPAEPAPAAPAVPPAPPSKGGEEKGK